MISLFVEYLIKCETVNKKPLLKVDILCNFSCQFFLYYEISLIKLFVVDPALDLFLQGSPSLFNTQRGCIS